MATNHRIAPMRAGRLQYACRRCEDADAEVYIVADRKSGTGTRPYTVGRYCRLCAQARLAYFRCRQRVDEAFEEGT